MNKYTLYVHRTCKSSHKLLGYLREKGLLDKIAIVQVEKLDEALAKMLYSVPALEFRGEIIAIDPLEPEFVEALILGDREKVTEYIPKNRDEAIERAKKTIMYSGYLSLLVLLYGDTRIVWSREFLKRALRSRIEPSNELFVDDLLDNPVQEKEIHDALLRVALMNYLRSIVWVLDGKISDADLTRYNDSIIIASWMMTYVSIGRTLLPYPGKKEQVMRAAEELSELLSRWGKPYLRRILAEYRELGLARTI